MFSPSKIALKTQASNGSANFIIKSLETVTAFIELYQIRYPTTEAAQMYKRTNVATGLNVGNFPPIIIAVISKSTPPEN